MLYLHANPYRLKTSNINGLIFWHYYQITHVNDFFCFIGSIFLRNKRSCYILMFSSTELLFKIKLEITQHDFDAQSKANVFEICL